MIISNPNSLHQRYSHITTRKKSSAGKIHSLTEGIYPGNGIQPVKSVNHVFNELGQRWEFIKEKRKQQKKVFFHFLFIFLF